MTYLFMCSTGLLVSQLLFTFCPVKNHPVQCTRTTPQLTSDLCLLRTAAAAAARLEAAGAEPVPPGAAAGRRRVAVVLSEEGVATAVPLQSVVEAGLSQRVLFQEDGQPVILEVLDQETDSTAAEVSFVSRFVLARNHLLSKLTIIIAHSLCYMSMGPFQLKCHFCVLFYIAYVCICVIFAVRRTVFINADLFLQCQVFVQLALSISSELR